VELEGVPMIGDALRDVEAAAAVGASPIWCSPARAGKRATRADCRQAPKSSRTSQRSRRASRHDAAAMILLRSALFWLALLLFTPPYALIALASAPLPRMARYRVISGWSRLMLWCLRGLCGIRWNVEGRENLPAQPSVILSKHQSAWETLAFQQIFPPQVHVLKRELLWIPFSAGASR
jgi:hypothetical protein